MLQRELSILIIERFEKGYNSISFSTYNWVIPLFNNGKIHQCCSIWRNFLVFKNFEKSFFFNNTLITGNISYDTYTKMKQLTVSWNLINTQTLTKLLHQSFCNTYIVLSVQYIKCKIYIITDNSMSFITPV